MREGEKFYFSSDVEMTGRVPGRYSMMAIGVCTVENPENGFYRELKPLNGNFLMEAMSVGCLGLLCLKNLPHEEALDPRSPNFKPEKVLEILMDTGEKPEHAMADLADWVKDTTPKGFKPVEAAAPIKYDGAASAWYFNHFYPGENPFGHSGDDINSMYRGVTGNPNAHIAELGLRTAELTHNALKDAKAQAREFQVVLRLMKEQRERLSKLM